MGGMPSPDALRHFQRDRARVVALAYRAAMVEGCQDRDASARAVAAYIEAGGNPDAAQKDVTRIVAGVAADHSEWLWRPVRARMGREDAAMRKLGWWPGPLAWDERRRVAAEAVARVYGECRE